MTAPTALPKAPDDDPSRSCSGPEGSSSWNEAGRARWHLLTERGRAPLSPGKAVSFGSNRLARLIRSSVRRAAAGGCSLSCVAPDVRLLATRVALMGHTDVGSDVCLLLLSESVRYKR